MSRAAATITRARKRMAHCIAKHGEAETLRQERQRASAARGAVMRYREALHLAELQAEWEGA